MTARVLNLGDMDGDGRDDLAAARSTSTGQAVWLFFSTDDDLSTPSVIIDGPTTGNPRFGWALAAGDIDDDGLNDLAISAREKDAVGAIYVWWGVAGVGIRRDLAQSALRGDLPSVNPDFW
ncbi:MAG: FG-GAP repeat protein, partial [Myxococcota bacterium]